jgi:UDPglucose 6-dehydrogenase
MNLSIIGTGYVGLVTGACFAEVGHNVICVDADKNKVRILKAGGIPIFEPGLEDLVHRNVAQGRLQFTDSISEAVSRSEVIFIAVPTPPQADGSVDLSYIESVARQIANCLDGYRIIVDKSTVPVKTAEKVAETVKRYQKSSFSFDVVSNPEFLREGYAIDDLMKPDRIVIGTNSEQAARRMSELYAPFQAPLIITDTNSAELIKHAANSFLALKISYANALSVICEASGANIQEVTRGMGLDARIGARFLQAGIGFGGSCFPKDLSAFIKISEKLGYDFCLLKEVERINDFQKERFLKKIEETLWVLKDKRIAVLGLTFKQNTDDVRSSPSIDICRRLMAEGAKLRVYDPKGMEKAKAMLAPASNLEYIQDPVLIAEGCDAVVIATEWPEFTKLDWPAIKASMTTPILFDGRNLLNPDEMRDIGFIYRCLGKR